MAHDNKYTMLGRVQQLETAVVELRAELARTRTHVVTELKNAVNDTCGQTGATGRDGASIVGPVGPPGKDSNVQGPRGAEGRRGDTGPRGEKGERGEKGDRGERGDKGDTVVGPQGIQGERGDITVYGDAELHAAVITLRCKLLEQRAAFLAVINQRIAEDSSSTSHKISQHFAKLLEQVRRDIERLQ